MGLEEYRRICNIIKTNDDSFDGLDEGDACVAHALWKHFEYAETAIYWFFFQFWRQFW